MRLNTVTIDRDGKPVRINARDFRQGVDVLWSAQAVAPVAEPEPATPDQDEAGRLIEILASRGIKKDRRASVETLRKLVAETDG